MYIQNYLFLKCNVSVPLYNLIILKNKYAKSINNNLYLFLKHGSNPLYVLPLVRPSRGSAFSSFIPVGTDRIPRAIRQIEPDSNTAHMDIKRVHASLPRLNESPSLPIVIAAIINRCSLL